MNRGNLLLYNGVTENERIRKRVACIIQRRTTQQVHDWRGWSERILSIEFERNEEN